MLGNKKAAFSLIEVVVSVALFSVIILSATEIFKLVIDSQRNALATQNVQESLKYFLEVTGKEMRTAQKNSSICPGIPVNNIFFVGPQGDTISFKNYYSECVTYSLATDSNGTLRFQVTRNSAVDFISPAKIQIDDLHFVLNENLTNQALVTINLKAHALNQAQFKSEMTIQTSLVSRYYK